MMETDADRLESIRALGGRLVFVGGTEAWAIYDNGYVESGETPGVEGRQPTLLCRSKDVSGAQKDTPIEVGDELYRVKRVEPDGTGMTRLLLKR
jgi:hypothetical protein